MKRLIIFIFVILYLTTSFASTMHIIDFFGLSNPNWLSILLGIAFELGAAASLCSLAVLQFTSKTLVWVLFAVLTIFQVQANVWHAYSHIQDYKAWVELFWLQNAEVITQKRVISIVSGAVLPLVALGFIKSLVDYVKPREAVAVDPNAYDSTKDPDSPDFIIPDFIPMNTAPTPSPVKAPEPVQSVAPEQIDNTEETAGRSLDNMVSRGL